ncbi:hypothetical protein SBRY_40294 [Actinacidiphila bryophytorum]|uniref:Uncharacterized protein n=1 Tax=Actinacidiphila bryophytorum TaxID=1436133 RepID=A0A9W4MGP7_9ACTN|nr:hypothetical protein SBRY_40294 [Actinacidiphila bryophytorum]
MKPATDRIAEPRGARTPFPAGGRRPERVDTQPADGVEPEDVEAWVRSASLLHSNGDAMDIAVAGGRIAGVRGRRALGLRGVEAVHRRPPLRLLGPVARAAARRAQRHPVAVHGTAPRRHRAPVRRRHLVGAPRRVRDVRQGSAER